MRVTLTFISHFVCLLLAMVSPAAAGSLRHADRLVIVSPSDRFELRVRPSSSLGDNETWDLIDREADRPLYTLKAILSSSIVALSEDGRFLAQFPLVLSSGPTRTDDLLLRIFERGRLRASFTAADLDVNTECLELECNQVNWLSQCWSENCPEAIALEGADLIVVSRDLRRLRFRLSEARYLGSALALDVPVGDLLAFGPAVISRPPLPGVVVPLYSLDAECVLVGDVIPGSTISFELSASYVDRSEIIAMMKDRLLPNIPVAGLFQIRNGVLLDAWGIGVNLCRVLP